MRRAVPYLVVSLLVLLGHVSPAEAQGTRPQFRPAVLGSGPASLINRIDTDELGKKGQKDGAVMFCAVVSKTGETLTSWTYRGMPGTQALEEELIKRLEGVKFAPAIYQYQPVGVLLSGTAIFSADAKPRLRIFLNQDAREFKKMSDFIAPQPVIGADSNFDGLTPPERGTPVPLTAVVELEVKVDIVGNLQDLRVITEEPPMLGFAQAATADFSGAKFIPAFRDGDPIETETVLPICYKPAE